MLCTSKTYFMNKALQIITNRSRYFCSESFCGSRQTWLLYLWTGNNWYNPLIIVLLPGERRRSQNWAALCFFYWIIHLTCFLQGASVIHDYFNVRSSALIETDVATITLKKSKCEHKHTLSTYSEYTGVHYWVLYLILCSGDLLLHLHYSLM